MEASDKITEEELHAWLDGELATNREAAVAAYLEAHPEVAQRVAAYRADGEAIRRVFGQHRDSPAARTASSASPVRPWHAAPALRRSAMVAMIVGAYGLGWSDHAWEPIDHAGFAREAAILHVIHSEAPVTPPSGSDHSGVAAALASVLGDAVPLPAMTDLGYQLEVVRPLPAIDPSTLQLVYVGADRPITVYIRKKPGATETPLLFSRHGEIVTAAWDLEDLSCAISGAVDPELLETFGHRLYDAFDKS